MKINNLTLEQIPCRNLLFYKLLYLQISNNNNGFKAAMIKFNNYSVALQNNGTNISCIFQYCSLHEGHWVQDNYKYLLNNRKVGPTFSCSF